RRRQQPGDRLASEAVPGVVGGNGLDAGGADADLEPPAPAEREVEPGAPGEGRPGRGGKHRGDAGAVGAHEETAGGGVVDVDRQAGGHEGDREDHQAQRGAARPGRAEVQPLSPPLPSRAVLQRLLAEESGWPGHGGPSYLNGAGDGRRRGAGAPPVRGAGASSQAPRRDAVTGDSPSPRRATRGPYVGLLAAAALVTVTL